MKSEKRKTTWRDMWRFAWHYWKPRKRIGFACVGAMMCATMVDSLMPVYTGKIVDTMLKVADKQAAWHEVWYVFGISISIGILYHIFRLTAVYFLCIFATRNLYHIVTDGMRKVQRFSADWHANAFAGGTVRKITRGMWSFDTFEDTIIMNLLPAAVMMVSMTIVLSSRLPLVGLTAATMVFIYIVATIWISVRVLKPKFEDSAEHDTKVGATLADIITGNPTVKSFGAERREDSLFENVAQMWREKSLHAWHSGVRADLMRSAFRVLMNALMIGLTIWLWSQGRATPGDIAMVIANYALISGYLRDIGMQISHMQKAVSEMDDIVAFWHREDEVSDVTNAKALDVRRLPRADLIAFDHVSFKYPNTGRTIYDGLSVNIAAGENIALVGPSGSGKSTFIKLLQRLYNVDSGVLRIDGQDISKVTLESLRQAIALVPQDPVLFHRSLSENIAYGRPDASQDDIEAAAKKAFAHDFIMSLPQGYDTLVGERGVKLSGGERQRVAIARALLADAPILVMDEATSSLDSISEHYIQKALAVLTAGRTTITVAHRLSTIRSADRILVFKDGRIVEQGTHATLMEAADSYYKKLYDMQALGWAE